MKIKNIVRETNPTSYSIIRNAKKNNSLSHAYLISANKKVDTTNVAALLLQTIVCIQEGVLACGECSPCIRIVKGSYADLKLVDGSKGIIKKESVISATNDLGQTPLEKNGKRILFIKNIESCNKQSINSLLKFIEEPKHDTYIVITTNSISNVLSTIKSRSQILQLKPKQIEKITNELLEKRISSRYARLLASIFSNVQDATEAYESDFIDISKKVGEFVEKISKNKEQASISFSENFSKNSDYILYLEILEQFFNDIWRYKIGRNLTCVKFESEVKELITIDYNFGIAIEEIWDFKNNIKYNANFDLLKEKLMIGLLG